jgi:hypothetical protein
MNKVIRELLIGNKALREKKKPKEVAELPANAPDVSNDKSPGGT